MIPPLSRPRPWRPSGQRLAPPGTFLQARRAPRRGARRRPATHLHTVMRFRRSTATLREDAFLEDSPRAMVVWTKLASIQMRGRLYAAATSCPPNLAGSPGTAPPPDHGCALGPAGRRDSSAAILLLLLLSLLRRLHRTAPHSPGWPGPRSPGSLPPPRRRCENKAGEGALRGAEPGPATLPQTPAPLGP